MTGLKRPSEEVLRNLVRAARRVATDAVRIVRAGWAPHPRTAERKAEGDFVTAFDLRAENWLRDELLNQFPDHGFLGEECGVTNPDAEFLWVVDPIDGTSNFAQGLPQYSVSVACLHAGQPVAASVYSLPEDEAYSAALGLGVRRGSHRFRTPSVDLDDSSMIGVQWFRGQWQPELLEPLCRSGARVRVFGSTVVQLCDVAVGRLHANVQAQARIWDIAAAGLVATEAGCCFSDWEGQEIFPFADPLATRHYPSLAASQPMHRALVTRLAGGGG